MVVSFFSIPIPGEMIQIDEHIFQLDWSHHLVDSALNWNQDISKRLLTIILP